MYYYKILTKENNLKKVIFTLILSSLFLSSCATETNNMVSAPTKTPTIPSEQIVITFADKSKDTHPSVIAINEFAKEVFEKSNGRIKIEVHANSELGSEKETTEDLLIGRVQMERVDVATLTQYNSDYGMLMLPYLYTDYEQMFRVLESDYCYDFMNPQDLNFIGLTWYTPGARSFYTVNKPITTLDDLEGLNIRIMENDVMSDYIKLLNANPIKLSLSEVNNAFVKGKIDGAENNIETYVTEEHYKYAKYVTLDKHVRSPEMIVVNKEFFNTLSKEDQQLLYTCAKDSSLFQRKLWKDTEKYWIETAQNGGATFIELSDEEMSKFQERSVELYEKYIGEKSRLLDQILSVK